MPGETATQSPVITRTRRELIETLQAAERVAVELVALGRFDWPGLPEVSAIIKELWGHKAEIERGLSRLMEEHLRDYGTPAEDDPTRLTLPQGSLGRMLFTEAMNEYLDDGAIELQAKVSRAHAEVLIRGEVMEKLPCA